MNDPAVGAAWLVIIVTLGIAIVGWARANRADSEARRATEAAERSAAAAQQSADAAERTADTLEKMGDQWGEYMSRAEKRDQRQWSSRGQIWTPDATRGPWAGPAPSGPAQPVVHWTVDRVKGRRHTLRNLGQATAYAVELTANNAVRFDAPEVRDVQMGESVDFLAVGSMQTGTPELIVGWRDSPDGERREWRRPLP